MSSASELGTHEAADLQINSKTPSGHRRLGLQSESVGVSTSGLPVALLAQIDRLANDERRTRGNAIRLLLEEALKAREA